MGLGGPSYADYISLLEISGSLDVSQHTDENINKFVKKTNVPRMRQPNYYVVKKIEDLALPV